MTDDEITRLLDRAASSYTPDASRALASVRTRSARHAHVRKTTSIGLAFLLVAVAVTLGVVLTTQGPRHSKALPYLRITPTAQLVPLATPSNGLIDVYFADAKHAIGMEPHCSLSPATNTTCSLAIVRTNDGGRTWTPVGQALHVTYPHSRASYPFINFVTNGKDGWIYGSKTFVTHDGGSTFTNSGLGGVVSNLSIVGNETWAMNRPCPPGIPGCSSTLYSTRTSGGPWHAIHRAPILSYPYLQLLRTSAKDAFLAAQASDGTLFATNNGGASWVNHPLPNLCGVLLHLTASTNHDVWVLCSGQAPSDAQTKELYHSVDAGRSWMLVATSNPGAAPGVGTLPTSGIVTLVTYVAPDRLWVALDHGPLIASTDGGRTWVPQDLPASGGVEQLTFANAQHGWALLSPTGTLYRTSDGGLHWDNGDSG
jgi:photosystem II stability/assembly factor-like uncharacterized protein